MLVMACGEDVSSRHDSTAAAADTVRRRWIPPILPPSATAIEESHNLDTNYSAGTFSFDHRDKRLLRSKLIPLTPGERRWIDLPEAVSGWSLHRYPEEDSLNLTVFNTWIVAVDWQNSKAMFWTASLKSATGGNSAAAPDEARVTFVLFG
jgi:hypothetical protein